jgi:hypothetical protein
VWFVFLLLGVVAVLMVWAAVIDVRARRRKVSYNPDPASVRDHRRRTDSDMNMRDMGGGGGF